MQRGHLRDADLDERAQRAEPTFSRELAERSIKGRSRSESTYVVGGVGSTSRSTFRSPLRHFSADCIICMREFGFRQA